MPEYLGRTHPPYETSFTTPLYFFAAGEEITIAGHTLAVRSPHGLIGRRPAIWRVERAIASRYWEPVLDCDWVLACSSCEHGELETVVL